MERQVIVAKSAGFCFGVERAVARVYEQIQAVKEGKAQGSHLYLWSHHPQ